MIKTYLANEDFGEGAVFEKARELLGKGYEVISIEHTNIKVVEELEDGWKCYKYVPGYQILVDTNPDGPTTRGVLRIIDIISRCEPKSE